VNISQNNTDDLNAIISIELKKEDYLPKVEKALNTAKSNAVIKGFRKGFVPTGVIKKMYGNSILLDELNKTVSESLDKYIQESKLNLLGRPLPKPSESINIDINNPSDFTFQFEIGMAPEVKVDSLNKKTSIIRNVITIDDKTLEEELDKIAQRYGNVTNPDEVKEGAASVIEKVELNQELFDKVYGPGIVTSLEEFKEKVRKELQNYADETAKNKFKDAIYLSLMESTAIKLPDAFLKKFIKESNDKPIDEEQIETEYPQFEKGLKWNLITTAIAKDNDIKVDFEDVKNFSKNQLRAQFMMYGGGITDEMIESFNDNMMAKQDHVKKSYDGALEQKLFTFIEDQVNIEEKTTSFDDFFKKTEEENK
jgi:trigger factor